MTKSSEGLTELGRVLLDVLKEAGDWQTRQDIASRIKRTRLNPYDVQTLETLAEQGLIEIRKTPIGVARSQYEYRVKG